MSVMSEADLIRQELQESNDASRAALRTFQPEELYRLEFELGPRARSAFSRDMTAHEIGAFVETLLRNDYLGALTVHSAIVGEPL